MRTLPCIAATVLLVACPASFALAQSTPPTESKAVSSPAGKANTFRGAYFEVAYPATFKATALDGSKPKEANAATFTAPDGSVEFYVFSPQWDGEAPGIALNPATETEVSRKTEPGKSSGVAGTYTWYGITAKDKRYTRNYQAFTGKDEPIHWVIGIKYTNPAALAKYQAEYARFKASLRQFAG